MSGKYRPFLYAEITSFTSLIVAGRLSERFLDSNAYKQPLRRISATKSALSAVSLLGSAVVLPTLTAGSNGRSACERRKTTSCS